MTVLSNHEFLAWQYGVSMANWRLIVWWIRWKGVEDTKTKTNQKEETDSFATTYQWYHPLHIDFLLCFSSWELLCAYQIPRILRKGKRERKDKYPFVCLFKVRFGPLLYFSCKPGLGLYILCESVYEYLSIAWPTLYKVVNLLYGRGWATAECMDGGEQRERGFETEAL